MKRSLVALGAGVALSVLSLGSLARAAGGEGEAKKACIDADTQGQALRQAGKLAGARAALKICVDPRCPDIVRTDCNERMDELSRVQPTLVVEAKSAAGADLSAVSVYVDGVKVADAVGGEGLPLDPGPHDLRFETAGSPPVTHHVILREGDRGRREAVLFASAAPPVDSGALPATTTASTTPPAATDAATDDAGKGRRTAGIAVAAGGVAVLGAGIVFGLVASGKWSSAKTACGPAYPNACLDRGGFVTDHDSAVTFGDLSTVGFIAGGALVAGGAVLYLTAPKRADAAAAQLSLSPSLGGAILRGTF